MFDVNGRIAAIKNEQEPDGLDKPLGQPLSDLNGGKVFTQATVSRACSHHAGRPMKQTGQRRDKAERMLGSLKPQAQLGR